jgi:hypothetical protein
MSRLSKMYALRGRFSWRILKLPRKNEKESLVYIALEGYRCHHRYRFSEVGTIHQTTKDNPQWHKSRGLQNEAELTPRAKGKFVGHSERLPVFKREEPRLANSTIRFEICPASHSSENMIKV